MSRYQAMFARLGESEGVFGAFVMLGDPDLETSAGILDALVAGGADMIEVALPFSDPIADGPVIQGAADRALRNGTTPAACFSLLAQFRRRHAEVPVGILTYANLVLGRGRAAFYRSAAQAGVDSVLVADVPAFEAEPFAAVARAEGIDPILIAAPNTPPRTLQRIAELAQGYTYCVSRPGVTGVAAQPHLCHRALFDDLARLDAPPPILGFGIAKPRQVREALNEGGAGVISGSAIVRLIEKHGADPAEAVRSYVTGMKAACLKPIAVTRRARPSV